MLLAIDVGNTQTVIGLFDDDDEAGGGSVASTGAERRSGELAGLHRSWRVATVDDRTADEHALLVRELLALDGLSWSKNGPLVDGPLIDGRLIDGPLIDGPLIDGIAVSSSVPAVTAALREMVARWFQVPLVVVEAGLETGMPILYDNPSEVGADRIVNAVAALDLFGAPTIVVDLGTATTFDAVSSGGEYLGGAIVPGVGISMDALFAHAAALRRVELIAPRQVIGRSTVESMRAGAIYGYAALVDGLCTRFLAELGEATVVATGGLAPIIVGECSTVTVHEPWLTLHGLRLVFERATAGTR